MTWWLRVLPALLVLGLQACGGSSGGGSCSLGSGANITISGDVTFDHVHHASNGGLDYNNITQDPVRGAVVEAVCNSAVTSTVTDASGHYSLNVPGNTRGVFIRVKAQMLKSGTPAWNFRVVNNTSGKALYVLDSSVFNTEAVNHTLNLHAASGWDGSSYSSTRAAAPFAILDSVYVAFQKVLNEDTVAVFPALDLNWSVNNVAVPGNTAIGQITTSHFNGTEIYILGAANADTDEYDGHVVIHEWGHYFEHNFSRADNIGGQHGSSDVLDIRVAFGEGFGNAWSGIATDDPIYADSNLAAQAFGFTLNLENNSCAYEGWYSECSVESVLYDLYDAANDDALALGFTPLYSVLVNGQRNTPAMTSIFSFIHELKQISDNATDTAIDTLLAVQSIDGALITDVYGTGQTTDPLSVRINDALPVYRSVSITSGVDTVSSVCSTNEFQEYNGYGVSRFIKFNLPTAQALTIRADWVSGSGNDPDMILYLNGAILRIAESTVVNSETMSFTSLPAGDYVLELFDYGNQTTGVGETCYDVTM